MELSFWIYLDLFSAILCAIYIIQSLVMKKKIYLHDKFFFFFMIQLAIFLSVLLIVSMELKKPLLYLLPFFIGSFLSLAPAIYLHISSLVNPQQPIKLLKHILLPLFFLTTAASTIFLILFGSSKNISSYMDFILFVFLSSAFVFVIQNAFYIYKILYLFRLHKKNLESYFSFSENIDLSWLRYHVISYIVFIVGITLLNTVPSDSQLSSNLHRLFMFLYVNFIGINAVRQKPIYSEGEKQIRETEPKELTEKQTETLDALKVKFEELLFVEQLYLDNELTAFKLAKALGSNTNYLSALINSHYGMNFANFINQQRVEYAKKALKKDENRLLTIESIGEASGFKSKSSFNAAFKKFTGQTPSDYLKKA
jgi:AraC-like DNA-binding protein